jgi:ribosome-associated protein
MNRLFGVAANPSLEGNDIRRRKDFDGADGTRTRDLLAASQSLSQLSYGPSRVPSVASDLSGLHCDHGKGTSGQLTSLEQARQIAGLAEEKLAQDIVILDMRPVCAYTDFFVVCSGQNARQTKAIVDEVRHGLKRERVLPHSVDGEREGTWIVADYTDVVLHVFTPEMRDYYRLEELWDDVPSIEHATG